MAELIQYANGVPGIKWPLDKSIIRIGRADKSNDISLDDAFASKSHARIEVVINDAQSSVDYYIRDMASTNHTYLNQAIVEHTLLSHNDTVVIGKSKFIFLCEGVREYVTPDDLEDYSVELAAKELDESLTIAVEEITKEFKLPEKEQLVPTVQTSKSDLHKFSRRLNLY